MILHTTGCLASDDVYRCLASEVRHYGILDYCEGQNPLFIRGKAIYTRRSILYIREKLWMCHMQSQSIVTCGVGYSPQKPCVSGKESYISAFAERDLTPHATHV